MKMKEMKNNKKPKNGIFRAIIFALILTNLFLIISSIWFSYENFYMPITVLTLLMIGGLFFFPKTQKGLITISIIYYLFFLYWNYNYFFVFAISVISSIFIANLLGQHIKVPFFIYSLIPLLILGHIIWFNTLPLGFSDEYHLDMGTSKDTDPKYELFLLDTRNVLTPTQSYGDKTWREFQKDGTFSVSLNTPIPLNNKEVEISMEYEATGPLYINNELFYDPKWGSAIKYKNFKEEYIYGAKKFNIGTEYKNTTTEKFLTLTESENLGEYILRTYDTNINEHEDTYYLGKQDLWIERENVKSKKDPSQITNSKFYNSTTPEPTPNNINELLILTGKTDISQLLKTPLQYFLDQKNQTLQEFMDTELNNGPYPKKRTEQDQDTSETVEEYLNKNFPNGILVKDYTNQYSKIENEMNEKYLTNLNSIKNYPDWNSKPKTITNNFRGTLNIYGLFDNEIKMDILKQDLNLYNGSDSVKITVKDFNNNIIATKIIDDNDNIITRTTEKSTWKKYSYIIPTGKSGIYYIEFEHAEESEDPDYIIGNITLNSNKVMYNGRFMLWGPGTIYNTQDENSIEVRYWWRGYDQLIYLNKNDNSNNKNNDRFHLSDKYLGSWVEINTTGNTNMTFEKGKLIINPKHNLAAFENTNINTDMTQEIIITKSMDLQNNNINFMNLTELNITGTKGTKIYEIELKIK